MKNSNLVFMVLPFLIGCTKDPEFAVPPFSDDTVTVVVKRTNMTETIPGYGIATGGKTFQVNIEAEDTSKLKVGQDAVLSTAHAQKIIAKVTHVLKRVSAETGQSIATLTSEQAFAISYGEFVSAKINVDVRKNVIAVSSGSVFIRSGKKFVVHQRAEKDESAKLDFVEVETGFDSGENVEVVKGLAVGDRVVIQGGIGAVFPDFKASSEGD